MARSQGRGEGFADQAGCGYASAVAGVPEILGQRHAPLRVGGSCVDVPAAHLGLIARCRAELVLGITFGEVREQARDFIRERLVQYTQMGVSQTIPQ
jgi:hypothetical protein